jgi:uracil-DNA glycosylase family 4
MFDLTSLDEKQEIKQSKIETEDYNFDLVKTPEIQSKFPNWLFTEEIDEVQKDKAIKEILCNPAEVSIPIKKKEDKVRVKFLPGRMIGLPQEGPRPGCADVMIIKSVVENPEIGQHKILGGKFGNRLIAEFKFNGEDPSNYYATSLVKFFPTVAIKSKKIKAEWVKLCEYFLLQEIAIIKPKFILVMGTTTLKYLFGNKALIKDFRDKVSCLGDAKVWICPETSSIFVNPDNEPFFKRDIKRFVDLINGEDMEADNIPEDKLEYLTIDNETDLRSFVDRMKTEGRKLFSLDCEWGGTSPRSGYLRSVQIGWDAGKAVGVKLTSPNNVPAFLPSPQAAVGPLQDLLGSEGVEVFGHFLVGDLITLKLFGVDCAKNYTFDTMYAYHTYISEVGEQSLEALRMLYTSMPKYDIELAEYKNSSEFAKDEGYGMVPNSILMPYGIKDADCTFRIYKALKKIIDKRPQFDSLFSIIMRAQQGILEIQNNGLLVDLDNVRFLTVVFKEKAASLLKEIREDIDNDVFNPQSPDQLAKLFYSDPEDGGLGATPLTSTTGTSWARAKSRGENPSADNDTMEMLSEKYPIMGTIRDYRIISKQCSNIFQEPEIIDNKQIYNKGIFKYLDTDNRLRSMFSGTAETGRWKSSKPNLQNLANKRQADIDRIFKNGINPRDVMPVRAIFRSSPGRILVEADYISAELVVLGALSGDKQLYIEATATPGIHDRTAVEILGAPCGKEDVKKAFPAVRTAAKAVSFGIPYQMGPELLAFNIRLAGLPCTKEQAEAYINGWYSGYPDAKRFIDECKRAVIDPGYLVTPWGRMRRFPQLEEQYQIMGQQREACNFKIQSTVGDALNLSLWNFAEYKLNNPDADFEMVNTVHDAILFETSVEYLPILVDSVIPDCMTNKTVIPPPMNISLGVDAKLFTNWGQKLTDKEMDALGIPDKYRALAA